jgi:uncharacterized damage-inducible protein DinB
MTNAVALARPEPSEHAPNYAKYIELISGNDIVAALAREGEEARSFYSKITEESGDRRYAPGKWTIREVLGHIVDTERIMACRALRFARNDGTPVPGFEQDDYVHNGPYGGVKVADVVDEFSCVRRASLHLFRHLRADDWMRRGMANGKEISVRALAYLMAGHEVHHRGILKERYLCP